MRDGTSPWPAPTGAPEGSPGWYLADDLRWYRSDSPPAPGYVLGDDGRWHPGGAPATNASNEAWRSSRWGLGEVWWCVLAYLFAGIAGAGLAALLDVARGGNGSFDDGAPSTLALFVACNAIATGGVLLTATYRKGQRSLRLDFGLDARWRDLWIGLGLGIAGLIGAGLMGALIDAALGADERSSNIPVDDLTGAGEFVLFFGAVAVVTPIIEELVFRGLLYRSLLKRGRSAPWAITATTALFVVPHLSAAESWVEFVSLAGSIGVLGLAFNLACHWTGNRLGAPIVAHMLVNGLAAVALVAS